MEVDDQSGMLNLGFTRLFFNVQAQSLHTRSAQRPDQNAACIARNILRPGFSGRSEKRISIALTHLRRTDRKLKDLQVLKGKIYAAMTDLNSIHIPWIPKLDSASLDISCTFYSY